MKKITIVCGQYGGGKTEFCINFSLYLIKTYGEAVTIADFDVINPYFRSREKAHFLSEHGIDMIGNSMNNLPGSDLPALAANIYGALLRDEFIVIDLAGSKNGLKPLALILDDIRDKFEFLCVLNAFRPGTNTERDMIETVRQMESFSGLKVDGIIHNSHLVRETTADDVLYGQDIAQAAAEKLNVPIKYTQLRQDIYDRIQDRVVGIPILFSRLAMREDYI